MSEAREYLNTGDKYVSDILQLAAKALSRAYQTTYDPPKDLSEGWIGIRVDVQPERLKAMPHGNAGTEMKHLLDLYNQYNGNASEGE